MSPKRELSAEAGSNEEKSQPSTPKKKTKTSASTPKTKSPAASGAWDASSKSALVRRLVETGYKHMDWKALAEEVRVLALRGAL